MRAGPMIKACWAATSITAWSTSTKIGLEKVSGGTVNRVYYGENAAYIETGDMMVLLASSSRAIVLPARCMTREDAELVRRTVLPAFRPCASAC